MSLNHKKYILTETVISAGINGAFSFMFARQVFAEQSTIDPSALIIDAIPQTLFVVFFSAFVPTFFTRRRLNQGKLQPLPMRMHRWPRHALLRGLYAAVLLTLISTIIHWVVFQFQNLNAIPYQIMLLYKILYGVLLSVLVTRWALTLSLSEYSENQPVNNETV